ncbi:hypothetical protein BDV95DRAFT_600449 [Massariosphaeria phaeospora]|uniref:Uncharacterized protein n=1 Tax=Massariosphaeria phaeospora TaxID=100035 RepID=A0A7C8IQM8_9PLEO|nr:hypothetical protein BDV95DRAFT_600449 [Massariosphaeria phaeospora]
MVQTRARNYDAKPEPEPKTTSQPHPHKAERPPANGRCMLLELPAELRNHIYDYTLSEENGVRYREGENGQAMLCLRDTTPEDGTIEANQLQYVNKQFRAETRCLGFKLNDLWFKTTRAEIASEQGGGKSAIEQAVGVESNVRNMPITDRASQEHPPHQIAISAAFLPTLDSFWTQHLRNIFIRDPRGFVPALTDRATLVRFCARNTHITIHWVCPTWMLSVSLCHFFSKGVSYTLAYRDIDKTSLFSIFPDPTWDSHYYENSAHDLRQGMTKDELVGAPNFKVYPWNVIKSRVKFAIKIQLAMSHCQDHLQPSNSINKLEKQLLEWFDYGI